MGTARWARGWFAATALAVVAALAIQVAVAAGNEHGRFDTVAGRIFNVFCFFTIQSNVLVGVTSGLLALRPERRSTAFATARLTALVAITITGVVYHAVLADLHELTHWALVADVLLHTAVPLLALAGWFLFGPRGATSRRVALLSLAFPLCWLAFTLIRGPIVHFYPYPFLDANVLGYPLALANCAAVAVLFVAVAAAFTALDGRLPHGGRRRNGQLTPARE